MDDLEILLENALIENRPDFVHLILEQEISLQKFLTRERLQTLYNKKKVFEPHPNELNTISKCHDFLFSKIQSSIDEPFLYYLKKKYNIHAEFITNAYIKMFLEQKFYFIDLSYLEIYENDDTDVDDNDGPFDEYHEFYLFIWCILTNRLMIAKTFWRLGKVYWTQVDLDKGERLNFCILF